MSPNNDNKRSVINATTAVGIAVVLALLGVAVWNTVGRQGVGGSTDVAGNSATDACTLDKNIVSALRVASTGEVAAFAPMDRPYSVAHFRFKNADGVSKTIADWTDRTVLLNLWATWCAPCRAEMPFLDELESKLGSDKFEVVPISVDRSDPSKPMAFFKEISIKSMGFFHDREAMTLNALKSEGLALGLPATLLVDGRGCVIGRLNGPAEWASEDAQNLIKAGL